MTGFGEAEKATDAGLVRVEIKTVNHRFFNVSLRTPQGFDRLETEIQSWLRLFIGRGHVSYTLSVDRGLASGDQALPELDLDRATRYRDLLETLRSELDLEGPVELSHLARFGEIFRAPDPASASADVDTAVIKELTEAAAGAVVGGLDLIVAGSAVFGSGDIMGTTREMVRRLAELEERERRC